MVLKYIQMTQRECERGHHHLHHTRVFLVMWQCSCHYMWTGRTWVNNAVDSCMRVCQVATTKGTGGDVIILEEAAYCNPDFFYETVAPLMLIGRTSLLGISTLTSEINFYSRLIKMKDGLTGVRQPVLDFGLLWYGVPIVSSSNNHRSDWGVWIKLTMTAYGLSWQ